MELASSQKLLARLYTDSVLQRRFYADPVTVGAGFGLSEPDSKELANLPQEYVRNFTKELRRDRLQKVTHELPLSHQLMGREFGDAFREYLLKSPPPTDQLPWKDALRFVDFFPTYLKKHSVTSNWAFDLLRFEAARLHAIWEDRAIQLFWSRFRIRKLVRLLRAKSAPQQASAIPSFSIIMVSSRPEGIRAIGL
ncbi:MAG: hypothetical protein CMO80_05365 [Verrucomicrobiales bacterium]|nr:hypothetical protein [Verrucomicrobiales bacterium]|tara:strand:+ start:6520 stop:7104 length:585 start_codon:yes stop_codon:yes gene_type:complete